MLKELLLIGVLVRGGMGGEGMDNVLERDFYHFDGSGSHVVVVCDRGSLPFAYEINSGLTVPEPKKWSADRTFIEVRLGCYQPLSADRQGVRVGLSPQVESVELRDGKVNGKVRLKSA